MAFPTPTPSRTQSQAVFDPAMEAFLAHLPTFEADVTAMAEAMSLNDTTDVSTSSVLIGLGAKTFVVTAGKSFQPGMYLIAADAAAPSTNSMVLQVTSYSGASLVTDCKAVRGSGTIASWVISLSAAAADIAADINAATAKTTPVDADKFGIWDSVSGLLRSVTWANLKAALVTYLSGLTGTWAISTSGNAATATNATNATTATNATNLTGSGTVSATATGGAGLTPTNATNATNLAGGTATIGSGGTAITKYLSGTASIDTANIPANSTVNVSIGLVGVASGDMVIAQPNAVMESGLVWGAYADSDAVIIRLANVTTAAIDPGVRTWRVSAIKH